MANHQVDPARPALTSEQTLTGWRRELCAEVSPATERRALNRFLAADIRARTSAKAPLSTTCEEPPGGGSRPSRPLMLNSKAVVSVQRSVQ